MPPPDERATVARLSARLQTLLGAGGDPPGFAALRDDAVRQLGPAHPTTLEIEYALELGRDPSRTPEGSLPVWAALADRARHALAPGSPVATAIRSRHLRRMRACGRPGDLDTLIELSRAEAGHDPAARADLAWALRDRAWFTAGDPDTDLTEALTLIDAEVRRRSADQLTLAVARRIRAEVLLAAGRTAPLAAARALDQADHLVRGDDAADIPEYDQLPRPHVLLAEALLGIGRHREAARVARLAYALHVPQFDPARPLLALARGEAGCEPGEARATAATALRLRRESFPPDSYYVTEAATLVSELTP